MLLRMLGFGQIASVNKCIVEDVMYVCLYVCTLAFRSVTVKYVTESELTKSAKRSVRPPTEGRDPGGEGRGTNGPLR